MSTVAVGKSKSAEKAKPDKPDFDLAEYHRQNPRSVYVTVDTGEQWLSEKEKEALVYRDQVEQLFGGTSSTPGRVTLDEAARAVLIRRMFQKKSKKEIAHLEKVQRLHLGLNQLAATHPGEATEIILYALLRLPKESLGQVQEGVRRCLKVFGRERAERGPGRPQRQKKPAVLSRHVAVTFLRHVRKLTWPQIAEAVGMEPSKPNVRTLTRQRDTYARLIYESLLDCGVGAKGENLDRVLSKMDFHTTYMLGEVCGLPVRTNLATCLKLAKELFRLAARKGYDRRPPKPGVREYSLFDRLSHFYEMDLPHSTRAKDYPPHKLTRNP